MAHEVTKQDGVSFARMLEGLARGSFHKDATMGMENMVRALWAVAGDAGKARGTMTLTLKFTLDRGATEIDPTFTVKTPSPARTRSMLFTTRDGRLLTGNPEQHELPMGGEAAVRTVERPEVIAQAPAQEAPVRTAPASNEQVTDIRSRQANDR